MPYIVKYKFGQSVYTGNEYVYSTGRKIKMTGYKSRAKRFNSKSEANKIAKRKKNLIVVRA